MVNNSTTNCERSYYFSMVTEHPVFGGVYLFVTHIQPRAAHGTLRHITPGHWTSTFMSIYMGHISSLGLLMAPYIILPLVTGPVRSCIFKYATHIQPRAAHGALHHITHCHWTNSFMSIYMSHISSLGLLMTPYIILPLVTGPVHSCLFICHTYPA